MINSEWDNIIGEEYSKDYYIKLMKFVEEEYAKTECFPPKKDIFNCFLYTKYSDIKVVIIGQDPYPGIGQAEGLCFSVPENIKRPQSLRNIYKELESDLGIKRVNNSLMDWAKQGILLLNTILTVEKGKPLSHQNKGWEIFTDEIIKNVSKKEGKVIFILWGSKAIEKEKIIEKKNIIIKSAHPSPLSCYRGFYGSKPFSKVNDLLIKMGKEPIKW